MDVLCGETYEYTHIPLPYTTSAAHKTLNFERTGKVNTRVNGLEKVTRSVLFVDNAYFACADDGLYKIL